MYFLEVVKMSKVYKWKNGPGFPIYHYFRADVLLLERNNKHFFKKQQRIFQTSLYEPHVAQEVA